MSDPISALSGAKFHGFAAISEIGPLGMISLRAPAGDKHLAKAIRSAVGVGLPAPRRIEIAGDKAAAWMSPDEYLLVMPYEQTATAMAALDKALIGLHYLAAVVSDARAVFRVEGPKADQVLAKLCPVDLEQFAPGEIRRTRVAQVAAAFWRDGDGYTLVCFRSVAGYVMGLLTHSAMPGSELT